MTSTNDLLDPFDIVAKALGCSRESLSLDSAMYRDHGWDSFGHLGVVMSLEKAYGILINDDEIETYATMRAIYQRYEQVKQGTGGDKQGR